MERHRIGAESINDQQIEGVVWLMTQEQPAIPDDDPSLRGALPEIAEVGLRSLYDRRINLEEGPLGFLLAVAGN